MIELSGTINIPSADYPRVKQAMQEHIEATRKEPSNIVFEITRNDTNPELFHVFEQFTDRAGFETHQELGKSRAWGGNGEGFRA